MNPIVAIIVGVYNGERYLTELLDSILAQTCADWECICVNDGSSDSSGTILESYANRDSRIRVIAQKNSGVGAARNTGLGASNSKYVMFADQDDKLLPDAVATALTAIESYGTDIVRFQSNRHARRSPFVWERIFRQEAIKGVWFPTITGGEDTAFLWELNLMGLKAEEIPNELYYNRPHFNSFSRAVSTKYIQNVFAGFRHMKESGLRHHMNWSQLLCRLFPHVFWFSVSILVRNFSCENVKAIIRECSFLLFGDDKEVKIVRAA